MMPSSLPIWATQGALAPFDPATLPLTIWAEAALQDYNASTGEFLSNASAGASGGRKWVSPVTKPPAGGVTDGHIPVHFPNSVTTTLQSQITTLQAISATAFTFACLVAPLSASPLGRDIFTTLGSVSCSLQAGPLIRFRFYDGAFSQDDSPAIALDAWHFIQVYCDTSVDNFVHWQVDHLGWQQKAIAHAGLTFTGAHVMLSDNNTTDGPIVADMLTMACSDHQLSATPQATFTRWRQEYIPAKYPSIGVL